MKVPETFFSVSEEMRLFFMSCLLGAALGLFYDVFRTLRTLLRHSSAAIAAEDIIFVVCWGVSVSVFASAFALSRLRGFFVIGSILGFILYLLTVGQIVSGTVRKFISFIITVFRTIFRPFVKCFALIRTKAAVKFVGYSKIFAAPIKKIKMLLPKAHNLLYNKTENNKRKNVDKVGKKKNCPQKKGAV
jgi:hypothetical protein